MRGSAAFRTSVTPGGTLAGPWVRNSLWAAARAVPSLDLRFAENKSLVDATTGQNLVTFTRASSGRYVDSDGLIKTATTNAPRFDHNPTTGESLGLLVEEQRTNLLLYSACDSNWPTGGFGTATYNLELSALGLFSGVQIASAGQNWHSIYRTGISLTASTVYAFTLFYRAGTSGRVRLTFRNNTTATETVVNGLVGNLSVSAAFAGSATITSQYLCSDGLTYVVAGTYTPNNTSADHWYRIGPDSTTNGQTVIALGGQLEAGAFPTSYIPTTTATATRSADVASITGSNFSSWYRQDEGTVFASSLSYGATNSNRRIAFATDGTTSNRFGFLYNSSNAPQLVVASAGVITANPSVALTGANYAIAAAYKLDDYRISAAGSNVSADTSGALPVGISQLSIGSQINSEPINGTIRRLTYWPQRLPDSTLQQITQ